MKIFRVSNYDYISCQEGIENCLSATLFFNPFDIRLGIMLWDKTYEDGKEIITTTINIPFFVFELKQVVYHVYRVYSRYHPFQNIVARLAGGSYNRCGGQYLHIGVAFFSTFVAAYHYAFILNSWGQIRPKNRDEWVD